MTRIVTEPRSSHGVSPPLRLAGEGQRAVTLGNSGSHGFRAHETKLLRFLAALLSWENPTFPTFLIYGIDSVDADDVGLPQ